MEQAELKVGIISCSGEELCEGTISRLATRKVLEELRPGQTVTICLPLFLAGDEQERAFARFHPTITVDGCDKRCAQKGTETHSGPVSASVVVTEVLGPEIRLSGERSCRKLAEPDRAAVDAVAERIAAEVDAILGEPQFGEEAPAEEAAAGCSCSLSLPMGEVAVDGRTVSVVGLPLIFQQLAASGVKPEPESANRLLEVVKIYHSVEPAEEAAFAAGLLEAYRAYCATHS